MLYREAIVITNFKNELRSSIHMRIKIPEVLKFIWHYEITVIIVYVMIWVVWIVPSIVHCVVIKNQIYILKSNMRDNIWFICVCYYSES
jgi:hypothetical protein